MYRSTAGRRRMAISVLSAEPEEAALPKSAPVAVAPTSAAAAPGLSSPHSSHASQPGTPQAAAQAHAQPPTLDSVLSQRQHAAHAQHDATADPQPTPIAAPVEAAEAAETPADEEPSCSAVAHIVLVRCFTCCFSFLPLNTSSSIILCKACNLLPCLLTFGPPPKYLLQVSTTHLRLYTADSLRTADRTTLRKTRLGVPAGFAAPFSSPRGPGIACLSADGTLSVRACPPP